MKTSPLRWVWVLVTALPLLAASQTAPAVNKPTVIASQNAPVATDGPQILFENADLEIVGVGDRHPIRVAGERFVSRWEDSQAPGLYALDKNTSQWMRIEKVLLKDAVLGHTAPGSLVQQPFDLRPLATQEYVTLPFRPYQLPGRVEYDDAAQKLRLRFEDGPGGAIEETILVVAIKDLKNALAHFASLPKVQPPAPGDPFAAFLAGASAPAVTSNESEKKDLAAFFARFAARTGIKLVPIPAGRFIMGSPADEPHRARNEGPQTQVTLTRDFFSAQPR